MSPLRSMSRRLTSPRGLGRSLCLLALLGTCPAFAQMAPPIDPHAVSPHGASPHGASPHGGMGMGASRLQMTTLSDPSLPAGTVVVEVLDEKGKPFAGALVQLVQQFQSVAQGNQDTSFRKNSDENGQAIFADLKDAIRFSYAVTVVRSEAEYIVPGFRVGKTGQRVIVPTYPVTTKIDDSMVGMRGFNFVELRADVLKIDVMYRVMNMGETTWLPKDVFLQLPKEASAVDVGQDPVASGFANLDGKVALTGSFPPGQRDVQFTFQLPNSNTESRTIPISVLPHTAELRVLSEMIPGLSLDVSPGFEAPQIADGPTGKKVLITRRLMQPGQSEISEVKILLGGLPVTGPGRWIAVFIALGIASMSLIGIFGQRSSEELLSEKKKARETLLKEMLLVERAFEAGDIGPRTFEQTRREILTAIARLEGASAVG